MHLKTLCKCSSKHYYGLGDWARKETTLPKVTLACLPQSRTSTPVSLCLCYPPIYTLSYILPPSSQGQSSPPQPYSWVTAGRGSTPHYCSLQFFHNPPHTHTPPPQE